MLRQIGIYNKLPESMQPKLPKKGTVVRYRHLTGSYNEFTKKHEWPYSVGISPLSRVRDPQTGEWIPVGVVQHVDQFGNAQMDKLRPSFRLSPVQGNGEHRIIIGDDPEQDDLYLILEVHSANKANKNRDTNEPAILERIDEEGEAIANREARANRREAILAAAGLDDEEVTSAVHILGLNPTVPLDAQRDAVEHYAESYPDDFMQRWNDPNADIMAAVKQAKRLDVLKVDGDLLKWSNGGIVMQIADSEKEDEEITAHFANEKNAGRLEALYLRLEEVGAKKAVKAKPGKAKPGKGTQSTPPASGSGDTGNQQTGTAGSTGSTGSEANTAATGGKAGK